MENVRKNNVHRVVVLSQARLYLLYRKECASYMNTVVLTNFKFYMFLYCQTFYFFWENISKDTKEMTSFWSNNHHRHHLTPQYIQTKRKNIGDIKCRNVSGDIFNNKNNQTSRIFATFNTFICMSRSSLS